eukprot:c20496_g2_i1.p1 GENE.c20496_g2_i1~~c20496_g2_i1.p1  ORF type:complete len:439 (+),score=142.70 c20496_g2_i1:89-1405(+)
MSQRIYKQQPFRSTSFDSQKKNYQAQRCSSFTSTSKSNNRHQKCAAVIGPISDEAQCDEIVAIVSKNGPQIKSRFYREDDKCVYIYYNEDEDANITKKKFNNYIFHDTVLKACSPIEYFGNEEDAKPGPKKAAKPVYMINQTSSSTMSSGEIIPPSSVVILKNIKDDFRQEQLNNLLEELRIFPERVDYNYGMSGNFRGMAFMKFPDIESSSDAMDKLLKVQIGGKPLKVEFKKRNLGSSSSSVSRSSTHSTFGNSGNISSYSFSSKKQKDDPKLDQMIEELNQFAGDNRSILHFCPPLTDEHRLQIDRISEGLNLYCVIRKQKDGEHAIISKTHIPESEIDTHFSSKDLLAENYSSDQILSFHEAFQRSKSTPKPETHVSWSFTAPGLISESPIVHSAPMPLRAKPKPRQPKGPDGSRGFVSWGRGTSKISSSGFCE